jgi:hypothetical protein
MTQSELRQFGTNHHLAAREITPVVKHRPQKHNFEAFCEPDDDEEAY